MDTKFKKQSSEFICCYGLRTARQKKRLLYKDFDKQLIALQRRKEITSAATQPWLGTVDAACTIRMETNICSKR